MRVTPLKLHACARLPALTDVFSTPFAVAAMSVDPASITIETPASHGIAIGQTTGLSVVNADTPNTVAAAVVNADGTLTLTLVNDHTLTSPEWTPTVKLGGFSATLLNSNVQLKSVDAANQFTVRPPFDLTSITLTGSEVLLERMEAGVIGWHQFTAIDSTHLRCDAPPGIERSYTVANPRIVSDVRVFAALDLDTAKAQYVRGYKPNATSQTDDEIAKTWMVICPWPAMRVSQDRMARTDLTTERTALSSRRRMLVDGYYVFVAIPAEFYGGAVGASDLANGPILAAVLQTFDGLILPRSEFFEATTYVHTVVEHGATIASTYDGATYWHGYSVEAPAELTQWDGLQPYEWPAIDEAKMTVASGLGPATPGGALVPASIAPIGTVALRQISFTGPGIRHDEAPQPLTATVDFT